MITRFVSNSMNRELLLSNIIDEEVRRVVAFEGTRSKWVLTVLLPDTMECSGLQGVQFCLKCVQ
jgi:hypothetical protein